MHDDHAAFVPMSAASPAMQELELEHDGLEWLSPHVVMTHPFDDGSALTLHRDVGATCLSLGAAGPGWRQAMDQLLPLADTLTKAVVSPLPPVGRAIELAVALRRDGLDWARRMLGSIEALGLEVFGGDERATAWIAGCAQHSGLPPSTAGSGALGLLLAMLAHSRGWTIPRGGMGAIVSALVTRGEREGASIRCDAPVERILTRNSRVVGVRLASGEEMAADAVISTVSAKR